MTDLADEFATAVCSLTPQRIEWLRSAGIPDEAIFAEPLMVGASPVETYGGGFYEPRDEGPLAVLVPAGTPTAIGWDLVDIIAFHLERPERWWRRTGEGQVLGTMGRFSVEPQRLHSRPLDWLHDQGRGLCPLDWGHDPLDLLLGAGALTTDPRTLKKLRGRTQEEALRRVNRMFANG